MCWASGKEWATRFFGGIVCKPVSTDNVVAMTADHKEKIHKSNIFMAAIPLPFMSLNTYGIVVESSVQHCAIVLLIVLLLFLLIVILIVLLFPRPQQQSCCCIVFCDFNCLYPIQC
jgi:hypothetical protein